MTVAELRYGAEKRRSRKLHRIIDAFVGVLRNASLASREKSLDARMVITFDGISDTPLATITANTERATALYRYRINLKTGAIQRS